MILQDNITHEPLSGLGLKLYFAGIDLAPNEQLESGLSVLSRDRTLLRADKLYKDRDILAAIDNMGPANNVVVLIDMPRSLSVAGRWRQEQIRFHADRLTGINGQTINRYDKRALGLYDALMQKGCLPFLYFGYWARLNYRLIVPFRTRTSQGCRALQTAVEHQLKIGNLPQTLAAGSVLGAMVGAYGAWSVWAGEPETDFSIHTLETGHRIFVPNGMPHQRVQQRKMRSGRKFFRAQSEYSKKI